jgi:hypothetical protein
MNQLPRYRPEARETGAPQPGPQGPQGPDQTQDNNGGPKGFGQPAAGNKMSPAGGPASAGGPKGPQKMQSPPAPAPGSGKPGALYPPAPPMMSAQIWGSRNSMPPVDLIQSAFLQAFQRQATADEMSQFLQTPGADQLAMQLINMVNPGQQSQTQQAIMAPSQVRF